MSVKVKAATAATEIAMSNDTMSWSCIVSPKDSEILFCYPSAALSRRRAFVPDVRRGERRPGNWVDECADRPAPGGRSGRSETRVRSCVVRTGADRSVNAQVYFSTRFSLFCTPETRPGIAERSDEPFVERRRATEGGAECDCSGQARSTRLLSIEASGRLLRSR